MKVGGRSDTAVAELVGLSLDPTFPEPSSMSSVSPDASVSPLPNKGTIHNYKKVASTSMKIVS